MAEITFAFKGYPCILPGQSKPSLVEGSAQCRCVSVLDPGDMGAPIRVTWTVDKVTIKCSQKKTITYEAADEKMADFQQWLKGRHGFEIARDLHHLQRLETKDEMETTDNG